MMIAGFLLSTCLFTAAQAPSPQPEPEEVPVPLSEIRRLINAGEARQAVERLRAMERAQSEEGAAGGTQRTLLLGVALYHADDPAGAVAALAPIVDRLPDGSIERREAEQVLGLAAFATARFAEAVPRLEATRRWAGDNLDLGYALGQAYVQTGRPDDARHTFASLYRVAPDSAAAHLLTAQMMIRLEMEPLADAELRAAIAKNPELPNAHLLLGQQALFRGRVAEAMAFTERELAISPANAMAWVQLGDGYVRQGKWPEAIAALQKSLWLNPYYSAPYILLGRAYLKTDRPALAEGMLRRAIDYDPNNRAAHYLLAQVLQQLGRTDEAARERQLAERLPVQRGG